MSPAAAGTRVVAVLATLDTKGAEAQYLREQIELLGGAALLIDLGLVAAPGSRPDISREEVILAGGSTLESLLKEPTRQAASPVLIGGATRILKERLATGRVHAVLGLGGTQGTSNCTQVMQALPYGFPKLMVSTVASGDTSSFVGIKDVTMSFSVGDLLGLNPITRKILANAAGAAWGMAQNSVQIEATKTGKPVVGMSNLGVLTEGTSLALELLRDAGFETIVFHAVGSGGRAMEQMMKDGLIQAVFDYAMGEISDELFAGLRAGGPERWSVAGALGLPQLLVPGGAEHIGLFVEPNQVPEMYKHHKHVFHNPRVFAPRLSAVQLERVAEEVGRRLASTRGRAVFLIPTDGVSRYSAPGGPLRDPESDARWFATLERCIPKTIEVREIHRHAEHPDFVREAVQRLIELAD